MAKRVLILGGGFGGIYAARELDRILGSRSDVELTIVNNENFFLFTPLLHEVAAGDVQLSHIVSPIRQLVKKTTFLQGDVTEINLQEKRVSVRHCAGQEVDDIEYDYLLIGVGSTSNFFGLPGIEEHAFTMKSLKDAIYLRNAIIASLEEAEFDATTGKQKPLLTYVVAGAGFAGIETVAAMNDFIKEALKFYPHLKKDMVRIVCADLAPVPLPELGEDLGTYAQNKLTERGIELKLSTKIVGMTERGVEFEGGSFIRPVIFVWTAGVSPPFLVQSLPCKLERGRIVVNEFLEVPDFENVWALGDCALLLDPATNKPYPPTAQHASRQGVIAGQNMAATISGVGTKQRFTYKMLGAMAAIGHRAGVAKVMGMKFSGFFAWVLWRCFYLSKLPRIEKKIRVYLDWILDTFMPVDFVQYMTLNKPLNQNVEVEVSDVDGSISIREGIKAGTNDGD